MVYIVNGIIVDFKFGRCNFFILLQLPKSLHIYCKFTPISNIIRAGLKVEMRYIHISGIQVPMNLCPI